MSFSFQTEIKNISILLDNYIPDELPDDLFRELINIKNTIQILDNIYQGEYNNIYSIDEEHLDIIHKVLQNSSKQINNYFNDTIGQIWHYKLLLCSMDSEIREKEFDDIMKQYNKNDIDLNPMVLFYFIEERNDILNKKILYYIRNRYLVNL